MSRAAFSASGTNFPVMEEIKKKVYGAGKGNLEDNSRSDHYYTRGVAYGIMIVEAIREGAGQFRQGQGDDTRAGALGARAP